MGAALLQGRFSEAADLIMGAGYVDKAVQVSADTHVQAQASQQQKQKPPVADARAAWLDQRDAKVRECVW